MFSKKDLDKVGERERDTDQLEQEILEEKSTKFA